jgi:hypothetical protein
MKYFSEKTKKLYDSEEKLREEETAFDAKQAKIVAEKKALAEARKERAAQIEAAYKEWQDKEAEAYESKKNFLEMRNAFIKDYGSFHMTVRNTEAVPSMVRDMNDLLHMLFF